MLDKDGLGTTFVNNVDDFASRYEAWLRSPNSGAAPFTGSADELLEKYLRSPLSADRLAAVRSIVAREFLAVIDPLP